MVAIWAAGVLWCLARIARSILYANAIVRASYPESEQADYLGSTQPTRAVEILTNDKITIPITTGIWQPKILLPSFVSQWPVDRTRMVVRHELAHIERNDVAWNLLACLVHSFIWFQPLAWLAQRKIQLERERACDDRVLVHGQQPTAYATLLVELGSELSLRAKRAQQLELLCSMSIAGKPIEKRLCSILKLNAKRDRSSLYFRWTVVLMFSLIVVAIGVIRPFTPTVSAESELQKTGGNQDPQTETASVETPEDDDPNYNAWELISLPDSLEAKALDHLGTPIANAKLSIELRIYAKRFEDFKSRRFELITDQNGKILLKTKGLKVYRETGCLIWGTARADGQLSRKFSQEFRKIKSDIELSDIQFRESRTIIGRVIDETTNQPALDGRIHAVSGSQVKDWWTSPMIKCNQDGTFQTLVPASGRIALFALGKDLVERKVIVPSSQSEVADIGLEHGTSIFGKVVGADGNPIVGAIVQLTMGKDDPENTQTDLTGRSFDFAAKTDSQGKYRLPPAIGRCHLSIQGSGTDRDTLKNLIADNKPPIISPQLVDLDGSEQDREIKFEQQQLVAIRGTVYWHDGSPVANATAIAGVILERNGYHVDETKTNSDGEYVLHVPQGSDALVSIFGSTDENGVYQIASPANEFGIRGNMQSQTIGPIEKDIDGADWKLGNRSQ